MLLSASRRIRLLAATIHTALLRIPSIYEQFIYFLRETGDAGQIEAVLGSWCMAAEDVERSVATQAKQAWDLVFRSSPASGSSIDLDESSLNLLLAFIKRSLFDPLAVYTDLNPVQPTFVPTLPAHAARNKGGAKRPVLPPVPDEETLSRRTEEEEESENDRKGRLRGGALGVLRWILGDHYVPFKMIITEVLQKMRVSLFLSSSRNSSLHLCYGQACIMDRFLPSAAYTLRQVSSVTDSQLCVKSHGMYCGHSSSLENVSICSSLLKA